ncbi:MAG: nitronate monooxygenase [Acidimicrobiia bacterium]|nr:nitronate monooxygenase [Acidimicrobiia bacterium]
MLHTRLTDLLEIDHPVMLAGMGGVSYHELTAAVSEAGGFGCLGASTMSTEELVQELDSVRSLTNAPFGVDLLTAFPGQLEAQTERAIAGGMSVFVAGLGVPTEVIRLCHDNDVLVASMCGKVRHALSAVDAGCDLVIAQGTEAGGHTGKVATLPLVPQVVDAVGDRVPVVAAGGIVDGRGLAAALTLGADGVWIGTRFIATPEARTWAGYKEKLVETAEDGTVVSRAFTGKTLRAVRNSWTDYHEKHPDEVRSFPEQLEYSTSKGAFPLLGPADQPIDPDVACYPAGQGLGAINEVIPAGDLVVRMVEKAEAALSRFAGT